MTHTPECLSAIGLECNCQVDLEIIDALNDHPVSVEQTPVPETIEIAEYEVLQVVPICLPTCIPEFGIHADGCRNQPNAPIIPKCTICQNDIPRVSIETLNGLVCLDCGNCITCSEQVTIPEIEFCLKHEKQVQHSRCRMKTNPINLAKSPISGEYEIGLLNNCRLIIVPDVNVSIETNTHTALMAHGMLWESMNYEQKEVQVAMIEAVYSAMYMSLKQDKTEVKTKLRERDIARTTEAHAQAKKDRQTQLPSEKRKIGLQEKFMNGMLASGLTKEQAIVIWKSQGRVWVE